MRQDIFVERAPLSGPGRSSILNYSTMASKLRQIIFIGRATPVWTNFDFPFHCFLMHTDKLWIIIQYTALTLKVPGNVQLYGLYVYYVVHICDFGMLKDLCNANTCWLVYFIIIFLLIFFRILGYAHKKSSKPRFLRWHHLSITIQ